jgi:hypothetical protein
MLGPEHSLWADLEEFFRLADRLDMPEAERRGILGVSESTWPVVAARAIDAAEIMKPEFRRRLTYVLPLMRSAIANLESGHGPQALSPQPN